MDNRRPKRVIRNKKENIYLGTWRREKWSEKDGSEELETEGAREEAMERNNWELIKSCRSEEEEGLKVFHSLLTPTNMFTDY